MSVSQHTERLRDLGVPEKGSKPALEVGYSNCGRTVGSDKVLA